MKKKIIIPVAVIIISLLLVGCSSSSKGKPADPQTNLPVNTTDNTSKGAPGLSSIRMVNETTGWALGNGKILRTSNGNALPFGGTIRFYNSASGWLVGANTSTTSRKLYMTRDGGFTWKQQILVLPNGYSDGEIDVVAPPVFFTLLKMGD